MRNLDLTMRRLRGRVKRGFLIDLALGLGSEGWYLHNIMYIYEKHGLCQWAGNG